MAIALSSCRESEGATDHTPTNTVVIDQSLARHVCSVIGQVLRWTNAQRVLVTLTTPFSTINVDKMVRDGIQELLNKDPLTRVSRSAIDPAQSARDIVMAILRARNERYGKKEKLTKNNKHVTNHNEPARKEQTI